MTVVHDIPIPFIHNLGLEVFMTLQYVEDCRPKNWCLWLTPYPLFTPRNQGSDGTRDALVCIAKVYRNPRYMQLLLASETTSATNY